MGGHLGHPPQGDAISRGLVLALLLTCSVLPPFRASVSPSAQGLDWMISKCPSCPALRSSRPGGLLVAVVKWRWEQRERRVVMSCRPPAPTSLPCPSLGPSVSLASPETLLLPCSVRFDFTALRAWGSWQGKLFSNKGFKMQSWRQSYVRSGSRRQTERQAGQGAGRGRGTCGPAPARPPAAWPCGLGQAPCPLWAIWTMKPLDSVVSM